MPFFMCVDNGGEEREVFKRRGEGNGGVEPHHMQSLGHMEMPVTERWSLLACLPSWIYTNGIKDGGNVCIATLTQWGGDVVRAPTKCRKIIRVIM